MVQLVTINNCTNVHQYPKLIYVHYLQNCFSRIYLTPQKKNPVVNETVLMKGKESFCALTETFLQIDNAGY